MMVVLAAIGVIALSAAVVVRPVRAVADLKVTICHATDSETNPYVQIKGVDFSSVDGGPDVGDHLANHTGPVWPDRAGDPAKWGDIIPPFYSDGVTLTGLPGLNWPAGQAIFNNGCNIPNTPTVATIISPAGPVAIGTIAHDTAQISGATATAGGTISYALYSNNDCSGLLANLTPTVNAVVNHIAPDSKTFTFTGAGTFYFYAVYSGDPNNTGPVNSGCAAEPYTVNPNAPIPNTPTVATIISPAGRVAIGTIAHDTAQISGATATAGGTISYALYSNNDCSGLLANLTPTVNAVVNHIAPDSKTFTFTGAGTFYFYAVYSGDPNNTGPVNSGCAAEPYTVNPAEIVVLAGSGTPAPSLANTALSQNGVSPIPTIAFILILLASLATLTYANVKTVRNRS